MTFPSNWPVTFLISFHLAHISPYVDLEPILSTWRPIFHLIWCGKLRAFLHRPKTNIKKLKRGFFQIPYIFLNTSRTECKFECSFQLPLTENYFHIARKMSVTSFQMLLSSQILSDLWDLTRVAVSRFFSYPIGSIAILGLIQPPTESGKSKPPRQETNHSLNPMPSWECVEICFHSYTSLSGWIKHRSDFVDRS